MTAAILSFKSRKRPSADEAQNPIFAIVNGVPVELVDIDAMSTESRTKYFSAPARPVQLK